MTLLVAVADDGVSERVLATSVRLGQALGEPLSVVHLIEAETATAAERAFRDEIQNSLDEEAIEYSVGIEHVAGRESASAVATQIAEIATDADIDHIIVGHRSKGLLSRLLTGNTAVEVASAADVPVTIIPETP